MTVDTSSKVVQSTDVVACELGGDMALLHFETGIYYGLDAIGTRIWSMIESPTTVGDILGRLATEYDVEPAGCQEDVLALVQSMAEESLVEMKSNA